MLGAGPRRTWVQGRRARNPGGVGSTYRQFTTSRSKDSKLLTARSVIYRVTQVVEQWAADQNSHVLQRHCAHNAPRSLSDCDSYPPRVPDPAVRQRSNLARSPPAQRRLRPPPQPPQRRLSPAETIQLIPAANRWRLFTL